MTPFLFDDVPSSTNVLSYIITLFIGRSYAKWLNWGPAKSLAWRLI